MTLELSVHKMITFKSRLEYDANKCVNEKILHYSDPHDNSEFEKLVINTGDYSPASSNEISSIFSDISSSDIEDESTDDRFTLFYSPLVCCIEINSEFEKFLMRMNQDSMKLNHMLIQHPELEPIHRSFVLDWVMEICAYFSKPRDTYYQAMYYLDRYLAVSFNIPKPKFQLVGLTCLYLASKWEDTKAIKLGELLSAADMFSSEDVLTTERNILQALDFRSNAWTLNKWVFTLLHKVNYRPSLLEYTQITLLLDLLTLDIESLKFSYSVLASACIFQVTSLHVAFPDNSSSQHLEICQCIFWSEKYWNAISESPLLECQQRKLSVNHMSCKIILYSVQQFYSQLLEMFTDLNKGKIENSL